MIRGDDGFNGETLAASDHPQTHMSITANVSHPPSWTAGAATATTTWSPVLGITAKRQSVARDKGYLGHNGIAIDLTTGKALTASADVRLACTEYKGDADVVVVNLRTQEVTPCASSPWGTLPPPSQTTSLGFKNVTRHHPRRSAGAPDPVWVQ